MANNGAPEPCPALGVSGVRLFGCVVKGLTFTPGDATDGIGNLAARFHQAGGSPQLAQIYGFAFEGKYYDLAKPALFLVDGNGADASNQTLGLTGITAKPPEFVPGTQVWVLDQSDFSVRLDVEVGPIERILLENEIGPEQPRGPYAGASARLSAAGASARLRYAGASARLVGGDGSD